jgi:uncharacterized membrane protein YvbJ
MVYCYKCGFNNETDAKFCNKCGSTLTGDSRFEDNVKDFADSMVKFGKEVGEKAAEVGKKVAKEAKNVSEEVVKKVAPKPIACPQCKTSIFETDVFCYNCGNKRS